MWVLADVVGLFSINVGPFSRNVSPSRPMFSANVGPNRPMLLGRGVYVLGPLHIHNFSASHWGHFRQKAVENRAFVLCIEPTIRPLSRPWRASISGPTPKAKPTHQGAASHPLGRQANPHCTQGALRPASYSERQHPSNLNFRLLQRTMASCSCNGSKKTPVSVKKP